MKEREQFTAKAAGQEGSVCRIAPGLYADREGTLYFDVQEFLNVFCLPDTPEVRAAVWREVERDFGIIGITALAG